MPKKILILAGTCFQIPVIEYSKRQGHYVITCDNKPDNPGHRIADEYINVSTTDLQGVLNIAKTRMIDGILAYGSDPAALAAAYVSETLGLPGNSFNSVLTLSDKGLFRQFLYNNDFAVPGNKIIKTCEEAIVFFNSCKKNVFIKPVDSSGSKGITKLKSGNDLNEAFCYAMNFSRKKEVIIEEEIERNGPHIHGEAFVYNGEIIFMLLGDQYFSPVTTTAPMSTIVPSMYHSDIMQEVKRQLSRIIKLIGFKTGGLNIEIILGTNGKIHFIEIGARNGGNFMPELITLATGFNMSAVNVNAVLNEQLDLTCHKIDAYYTQLILHSPKNGKFLGYNLPKKFYDNILFRREYIKERDYIQAYKDSRTVIGVFLFKFLRKNNCIDFIEYIKGNNLIRLETTADD